jgi:hypothetical protein
MLVMYLCVRSIDVGHVFACEGYRCWSCICVIGVWMLVMYLCVRVSMLVMYLCVLDIGVGHVFVW